MNPFHFTDNNLDEVVFEKRNKSYGAYAIRKSYPDHINRSMMFTLMPLAGTLVFVIVWNLLKPGSDTTAKVLPDSREIIETIDHGIVSMEQGFQFLLESDFAGYKIVPDKAVPPEKKPIKEPEKKTDQSVLTAMVGDGGTSSGNGTIGTLVGSNSGGTASTGSGTEEQTEMIVTSEILPEFPGGMDALYEYLSKSIEYPQQALTQGVQGRVLITFTVQKDGQILAPEVTRGIGFGCDDEAVRVVEKMPRWIPGKQNGREVSVKYTLPIFFRMAD